MIVLDDIGCGEGSSCGDVKQGFGGIYGGLEVQYEELMGKRRMACQCQKWSCAEKGVKRRMRGEDGREGGFD